MGLFKGAFMCSGAMAFFSTVVLADSSEGNWHEVSSSANETVYQFADKDLVVPQIINQQQESYGNIVDEKAFNGKGSTSDWGSFYFYAAGLVREEASKCVSPKTTDTNVMWKNMDYKCLSTVVAGLTDFRALLKGTPIHFVNQPKQALNEYTLLNRIISLEAKANGSTYHENVALAEAKDKAAKEDLGFHVDDRNEMELANGKVIKLKGTFESRQRALIRALEASGNNGTKSVSQAVKNLQSAVKNGNLSPELLSAAYWQSFEIVFASDLADPGQISKQDLATAKATMKLVVDKLHADPAYYKNFEKAGN